MVLSQEGCAEEGILCSSPDDDCVRKMVLMYNKSLISVEIYTYLCKKTAFFFQLLIYTNK